MGRDTLSAVAYRSVETRVKKEGGSATRKAEQRIREGAGLNPLVDPKSYGAIRRSLTRMEKDGDVWISTMGLPMLLEVRFDTTSSMGDNVDLAFKALPRMYNLLSGREEAVLSRYDLQIITSIFNDRDDEVVLCRSQAEMGIKIAEQLTMMVPVRQGGDIPEDPQYGLFGAAYLVRSNARQFGLGTYDFTITDAPGRDELDKKLLTRIYGDDVFDKVRENGWQISNSNLPSTEEVVKALLKEAHAFVLQVGNHSETARFWRGIYGKDRVVVLPRTELIPEVQAAIIGLTEGRLDLQSLEGYLKKEAQISATDAKEIQRAVAGIPIGEQTKRPNFNKVFKAGAKFANKADIWPIGFKNSGDKIATGSKPEGASGGKPGKSSMWL
jgi:hypothetical protein